MKIEFWCIGKTNEDYLIKGIDLYNKRISRYNPYEMKVIPDVKFSIKSTPAEIKKLEYLSVSKLLSDNDYLILLDEKGESFTSVQLAEQLNKWLQLSYKRIVFMVGSAWGFDEELKTRANLKLSFSKLTFSHQMIRLFFTEQLYRVFSILHNEPYHNE